jgi:hypothetical protein
VTVNVQHDATKPFAQLLPDPGDPTKTVLVVMGTNGNDDIRLNLSKNPDTRGLR